MPKLAHLLPKVIEELGKKQDKYIILTADEYHNSQFCRKDKRGATDQQVHLYCINPESGKTLFEMYFKDDCVAIPLSNKVLKTFKTSKAVDQVVMKKGSPGEYISLRVRGDSEAKILEKTIAVGFEMMEHWEGGPKGINDPILPDSISRVGDDYNVKCGNCKEVFRKAKRCTFCGQLLKWPQVEEIDRYIKPVG